jgi:hypothetical protein
MVTVFRVVAVLAFLVGIVAAQDAPTLTQTVHSGEPLHYIVRFDRVPPLEHLSLYFRLKGDTKQNQPGFTTQFDLGNFKAISNDSFEVSGVIPKNAASGTWEAFTLNAAHDPATRTYMGNDLPKVTIQIVNDEGVTFGAVKSITPTP